MSPLEIVLYIGLGIFTAIIVGRTIYKFVKYKKEKKKGTGENKDEKKEE